MTDFLTMLFYLAFKTKEDLYGLEQEMDLTYIMEMNLWYINIEKICQTVFPPMASSKFVETIEEKFIA